MSVLRGFTSIFHALETKIAGKKYTSEQRYATYSQLNNDKYALDATQKLLSQLSTGHTLSAGSTKRVLKDVGHSVTVNQVLKFASGSNQYEEVHVIRVIDANTLLLSTELPSTPGLDNYTINRYVTPKVDLNGNLSIVEGITTVIDAMDVRPFIPTGGNLVPRSSVNAIQIVAALAGDVTRVHLPMDVGEFMNLYLDAARTQFLCHLPLTPDGTVDVDITAGASVYLGASKDVDIDDATSVIQMNFIG